MGFLDKLKNTFFEEEFIEEDEEEVQEKPLARKVELKKEEEISEQPRVHFVDEVEDSFDDDSIEEEDNNESSVSLADRDLYKNEAIQDFDDSDFEDEDAKPVVEKEDIKVYGGQETKKLYQPEYETEGPYKPYATQPVLTKFKPTPIISPIYGILDKNYKKEEVIEKKNKPSSYVSRRNVDLDYVRNKAFGNQNQEEDIILDSFINDGEDDITSKVDTVEIEVEENNDNLLVDMTESDCPAVEKVTIADAEEYFEDLGLEYNIDYKDKGYESATGRRTKPIDEEGNSDTGKETLEVIEELAIKNDDNSTIEENSKIDDLIEESKNFDDPKDNLFDLIDSMYDDEEEEDE